MAAPGIEIPSLQARSYPPVGIGEYDGIITVDMTKNALFMVAFKKNGTTSMCDIDEVVLNSSDQTVNFCDSPKPQQFQLCHSSDVILLQTLIDTCRDIFNLSLRINSAVRDCLYSGIRHAGAMPSAIEDRYVLSSLVDIVKKDLPAVRAAQQVATTIASTSVQATGTQLAVAATVSKTQNKAPRKCFFCQAGTKNYRQDNIAIHPYVTCDFKGADIYMCLKCVSNWKLYRDSAKKANELILPGETNEELCALCSSLPNTLVLCESCPRSYCEVCLSIVIGQAEFRKMKSQENWKCMECAKVSTKCKEKKIEASELIEKKKCTSNSRKKDKISVVNEKVCALVTDDDACTGCEDVPKGRGLKRKVSNDVVEVELHIGLNDSIPKSPSLSFSGKVVEAKELDELFYFGQYLKTLDDVYDCFRTRPACMALKSTNIPSRGSIMNKKKKEPKNVETQIKECSEDYCLLCKDGGDLIECDYVHKIFSETFLSPNAAENIISSDTKNLVDPNLLTKTRCRKVYHTACLGFDVDVDYWQCPKHYCAEGKCRNVPFYSCDLCPVSLCQQCANKGGDRRGNKNQYIQIALVSEYVGKDPNPVAPNSERMRIICNACIDMAQSCFERGELISENLLWLCKTNMKSFNPKSDLYEKFSPAVFASESMAPLKVSPESFVETALFKSADGAPDNHKNLRAGDRKLSPDDLKYFAEYLRAVTAPADGSATIGAVLNDSVLRQRLAQYNDQSIRNAFYHCVRSLKLRHLVKK